MSNRNQQEDELAVLESIYPDMLIFEGEHRLSFRFPPDVRLYVDLPEEYPSNAPPVFELSSPSMKSDAKLTLQNLLNDAYIENLGVPVLYTWVSTIQEFLNPNDESVFKSQTKLPKELSKENGTQPDLIEFDDKDCPEIISGETFHDRKSTFQAHFAKITRKEDVDMVMRKLRRNNKIARATHNIVAWRLTVHKDGKDIKMYDCKDDGEFGAASKMLGILEKMEVNNVIVVVSRWYGGIHLGPDRFRHINNLTRQILTDNGMENRKK